MFIITCHHKQFHRLLSYMFPFAPSLQKEDRKRATKAKQVGAIFFWGGGGRVGGQIPCCLWQFAAIFATVSESEEGRPVHAGGVCTEGRSDSTLAGKKCDLSPWTDCSPLRRGSFRADDDMTTPPRPQPTPLLRTCRITRDPRTDCDARCKVWIVVMRLMYIRGLQAPDQELMRVTGEMCLGSKKKKS